MKIHDFKYNITGVVFTALVAFSANSALAAGAMQTAAETSSLSNLSQSSASVSTNIQVTNASCFWTSSSCGGVHAPGQNLCCCPQPGGGYKTGTNCPSKVTNDPKPDFTTTSTVTTTLTSDEEEEQCEAKEINGDYTWCCKTETVVASNETCESKGYFSSSPSCGSGKKSSSLTVTLNGQSKTCYHCVIDISTGGGTGNSGGCSNACHTSCSAKGGTVYTSLASGRAQGGQQYSASGCDNSCFCFVGGSGAPTDFVYGPGASGNGNITKIDNEIRDAQIK